MKPIRVLAIDPLKYISDVNLLSNLDTRINIPHTVGIDRQCSAATAWHYGAIHVSRKIYQEQTKPQN